MSEILHIACKNRWKLHTTEPKIYPDAIEFLLSLRVRCPSIFSSIAIKLNVPCDAFSSIGIRIFKCDYISLYLHSWTVLRLCIVFSISGSPRVCSKYSHWYYLLLIWGEAKVSSIAIELFLQDQKRKFCRFFFFFFFNYFAHGGQRALIHKII